MKFTNMVLTCGMPGAGAQVLLSKPCGHQPLILRECTTLSQAENSFGLRQFSTLPATLFPPVLSVIIWHGCCLVPNKWRETFFWLEYRAITETLIPVWFYFWYAVITA